MKKNKRTVILLPSIIGKTKKPFRRTGLRGTARKRKP